MSSINFIKVICGVNEMDFELVTNLIKINAGKCVALMVGNESS